jgi:hypothetical protein
MKSFSAASTPVLLIVLMLLFAATPVFGQVRSATVAGTVQDGAGRVVTGADVTVFETTTSQTYKAKTNGTGNFTVPYLPAGIYNVTVVSKGFETSSQQGIDLGNGQSINVSIALKVGTASETVDVNMSGDTIQVDTATVQSVIGETAIASLPNIDHNPFSYLQLEAGVSTRAAGASEANSQSFGIGIQGRRQISDFAINGANAYENDIQLDGLSTQASGFNEVTIVPNQDAILEIRAVVNEYPAQYGRAHGIVQTTTKGGTDKFHGVAFIRNRSSLFQANAYAAKALPVPTPLAPYEIFTFGGAVGGPIKRTRAFFFASYEGLFWNNPTHLFRTVPTALERKGDFSQSVLNINGKAVPFCTATTYATCKANDQPAFFDPFSVTPIAGTQNYMRAYIPGANLANSTLGLSQYALNVLANYPLPNHVPSDAFNTSNFQSSGTQTFRKANINARVDYNIRTNNHLYITGGFTRGNIDNTPIWGGDGTWNPVVNTGEERFIQDRNPYISIGDTIILSPTLVVDLRYGVNRIDTIDNDGLVPSGFNYAMYGVTGSTLANIPIMDTPSFVTSGSTNWSPVNNDQYYNKHEHQLNHVVAGSVSKAAGRWNYKVGGEFRAFLANYTDSQTSALYTISNTFTVPEVNASGGAVSDPTNYLTDGTVGGNPYASFLLGAGSVGIPAGAAVHPAFLHQYAAVYTQNDWHPTSKLTVNLGARWDWQPGIKERYNRVSMVDLTATSAFGTQGAIVFPGTGGYNRRMWDTDWYDYQPRLGVAYRVAANTVIRGGFGVTFLPTNTGYFDGPYQFGSTPFDGSTLSKPYGATPSGVPVGTFDSALVNTYIAPTNNNTSAPQIYGGGGGNRFVVHGYKNAYVYQANLHVQQDLGRGWSSDIGYNGEVGKRLNLGSSYGTNSDQFLPTALTSSWNAAYIASNGASDPGTLQITNPFQPSCATSKPATCATIPFGGSLGNTTLQRDQSLWQYPLLGSEAIEQDRGFSTYHALQAGIHKDMSRGLLLGTVFTWSKSLEVDGGIAANNGFGEGIGNSLPNNVNIVSNKHYSSNDIPIRFASYGVYNLPFGGNHAMSFKNRLANAIVSGYRLSGTYIWQEGVVQQISASGSINSLPDRNPTQPFVLPKSYQHWYDGKTQVTLPSGRVITPSAQTFLKYNPDAFIGRVATTPNNSIVVQRYWFGNAPVGYGTMRSNPVDNITASMERDIKIRERYTLTINVNAANLLNHTQFAPTGYASMTVGSFSTTTNLATGNLPGYGTNAGFGAHNTATLDARLVEMQARFSF